MLNTIFDHVPHYQKMAPIITVSCLYNMLIKYSTITKQTVREVRALVGKPFSLWERLRMNGNGSQRFTVIDANEEILNLLETKSTSDPYINIELRPKGLIIHFRIRLDNWALVLPYYTLSIFSQDNLLNIYSGEWKLQFTGYRNALLRRDFTHKMLELKAKSSSEPH